jgi:hypothetical protein
MKTDSFILLITLITSAIIGGCSTFEAEKKTEETYLICGVSDPMNELPWLKQQYEDIKNIPYSGIILYRYNSKEVIEVQSSLMSSTNLSQYYCDGTKLEFDTPETYIKDYKDFLSKRIKLKILYGIDFWNL